MVLVDQTVEALPAHYWPVAAPNCWLGRPEGKSEMRSLVVVVIDVLTKHHSQVALAEDEQPIQSLVAEGLDHPLTVGVGARTSVGREHDLSAFRAEHLVELVDELAVAVMDEELDRVLQLAQLPGHVPSLLGHPDRVGMIGAVGVKDAAAMDLEKDQYVQRLE